MLGYKKSQAHCRPKSSGPDPEPAKPMKRIAYFTSLYPAISHTFIRREIQALEQMGVTIIRYAVRSAPQELVDPEDIAEGSKTGYILDTAITKLFGCFILTLLKQPVTTFKVLQLAAKVGWRSDRGILLHFVYVVEATLLAHWCRRDAVKHMHVHFGTTPAAIAMFVHHLSGVPYSFTVHGSEEFVKACLLSLDKKLHYATFAVCVSYFGRSQLMLHSPSDQWQKIALVHCGVDNGFLEPALVTPPASPRFVCIGRLCEEKAQLVLVAAASRLRQVGILCEIVFVGDGPMRTQLEEAVRQAGLEDTIVISGWLSGDGVKAHILESRAVVLPSFAENMPVSIMEAMALGRPVISTYIAGIPELIQPGVTGWLVPASDEVALADAMREALAAPVDRLAVMGRAARAHVLEHHDVFKEAAKLKRLIEKAR
jgi:colanic acid/amylovoran biosynthesis glycosyltransferase